MLAGVSDLTFSILEYATNRQRPAYPKSPYFKVFNLFNDLVFLPNLAQVGFQT
jgi:hypothetical protein